MSDTQTPDERIDTLADAIALLAVSGSTVFGGTDAREAVKEATRYKALCKCGIHDSCVDCHHENTSDDDERTCIQKLHDDFHAAEERARVLKAMCEWLARALAMKSWMSLTGITRQALGGDDEETRDAFVESETQSQLATAREAVERSE